MMPRKASRRRPRWRRLGANIAFVLVLALLIASFVVRRIFGPVSGHTRAYQPRPYSNAPMPPADPLP